MQKEEHYMDSILYVGMDVHTSNYTLCTYSIDLPPGRFSCENFIAPEIRRFFSSENAASLARRRVL